MKNWLVRLINSSQFLKKIFYINKGHAYALYCHLRQTFYKKTLKKSLTKNKQTSTIRVWTG